MVTPFGVGTEGYWDGILASRSASRRIDSFDVTGLPTPYACAVPDAAFDAGRYVRHPKSTKLMSRATRFAMGAAAMALGDTKANGAGKDPSRWGVAHGAGGVGLHDLDYLEAIRAMTSELGTEATGFDWMEAAKRHMNPLLPLKMLPNIAAAHIAIEHDLRGENQTVCTACTSGTQAIGHALTALRDGRADLMLAGGSDAMINPMGLIAFGLLGVLSTREGDPARASRPFDRDRDGFVMGEGSVFLVLETESHARRRGVHPLAELAGYGGCSDAFRITDEREDGSGCAEAMRRALHDAGTAPEEIDYVNAHGTGTRMNDRTEVDAIRAVFGRDADRIAVSSTKSQVGHMIAAAGAVEAATCVLALRDQILPPTINLEAPDPDCDLDFVPHTPRRASVRAILSNSFGFGGQNACLVLRQP